MQTEVDVLFSQELHEFLQAQVTFLNSKRVENPAATVVHGALKLLHVLTTSYLTKNVLRVEGAPEAETFLIGEALEESRFAKGTVCYHFTLDKQAQEVADFVMLHTPCASYEEVMVASIFCLEWALGIISAAGALFLPIEDESGEPTWTPCDLPFLQHYKRAFYH